MKLDVLFYLHHDSLTTVLKKKKKYNNIDYSESFNYLNVHTCMITQMKTMLKILVQLKEKEQSGKYSGKGKTKKQQHEPLLVVLRSKKIAFNNNNHNLQQIQYLYVWLYNTLSSNVKP